MHLVKQACVDCIGLRYSHVVVTAPTNSVVLHTARYKLYLFTYLLT